MEKVVLFAFRGDAMCFVHVLLNAIDLHERGGEGLIVMEGEAVKLIPEMSQPGHFLSQFYQKAKDLNLIVGACRACSIKLKVANEIKAAGIPLIGEMSGHPSIGEYIEQGYRVITF
ncbi:MAG: cytoplasmic protein [bacterium]